MILADIYEVLRTIYSCKLVICYRIIHNVISKFLYLRNEFNECIPTSFLNWNWANKLGHTLFFKENYIKINFINEICIYIKIRCKR